MTFIQQFVKVGALLKMAASGTGFIPVPSVMPPSNVFAWDTTLAGIMRTPAPNTVGVHLRNAYWLAVASIAAPFSQAACKRRLLANAFANWLAAGQAAGADATYWTGLGLAQTFIVEATTGAVKSAEVSDIEGTYNAAIAVAKACAPYGFVAVNNLTILRDLPVPEDERDGINLNLPTGPVTVGQVGLGVVFLVGLALFAAYAVSALPKAVTRLGR